MTRQVESPPSSQDEKECISGQSSRQKERELARQPKRSHRAFTDEEEKAIFEYIENRGNVVTVRSHGKKDLNVHRNSLLLSLGIYGGLSFVEMVSLRVGDIVSFVSKGSEEADESAPGQWVAKERIQIKNPKKLSLSREICVHPTLKKAIDRYVADEIQIYENKHLNPSDPENSLQRFVFYSQQCLDATRPVTYQAMRSVFLEFEKALGLGSTGGRVGIHSMKRTLQTRICEASGNDAVLASKCVGSTYVPVDPRYRSITQSEIDKALMNSKRTETLNQPEKV